MSAERGGYVARRVGKTRVSAVDGGVGGAGRDDDKLRGRMRPTNNKSKRQKKATNLLVKNPKIRTEDITSRARGAEVT